MGVRMAERERLRDRRSRRDRLRRGAVAVRAVAAATSGAAHAASPQPAGGAAPDLDRSTLPIALPMAPPLRELDVRKVPTPPHVDVVAPCGAPKVVIVLIDDLGFGVPGAFGGPIAMPTLDRLAQGRRFGGPLLYVKDGVPGHDHNWLGLKRFSLAGTRPLPPGRTVIRMDAAYDGRGPGNGVTASLFVGDEEADVGEVLERRPVRTGRGDRRLAAGADDFGSDQRIAKPDLGGPVAGARLRW
jgi:hypothetical protein